MQVPYMFQSFNFLEVRTLLLNQLSKNPNVVEFAYTLQHYVYIFNSNFYKVI